MEGRVRPTTFAREGLIAPTVVIATASPSPRAPSAVSPASVLGTDSLSAIRMHCRPFAPTHSRTLEYNMVSTKTCPLDIADCRLTARACHTHGDGCSDGGAHCGAHYRAHHCGTHRADGRADDCRAFVCADGCSDLGWTNEYLDTSGLLRMYIV